MSTLLVPTQVELCANVSQLFVNVCSSTTYPCGSAVVPVGSQQLQQLQGPGRLNHNCVHPDHAGQDENGVAVADPLLLGGDRSPEHHTNAT